MQPNDVRPQPEHPHQTFSPGHSPQHPFSSPPPPPEQPSFSRPEHPLFNSPEPTMPSSPDPEPVVAPKAVVKVGSTRGLEYGLMALTLLLSASSFDWVLSNLVEGSSSFDNQSVPASILIVTVPVFGWLFLKLKKAELQDPALRAEPSKRRWTHLLMTLAFLSLISNLIFFIYTVLQHFGSDSKTSIGKATLEMLVTLVISGGILLYFWRDEHKHVGY